MCATPYASATLPPKRFSSRHSDEPMTPGETVLTRTPSGATSSLSRLEKLDIAALASL